MNLHFSKFDQAIEGCRNAIAQADQVPDRAQRLETQHFAAAAMAAIMGGQRFYLPDAAFVLEGRPLDEAIKSTMRLPYEVACVLTETKVHTEAGDWLKSWEITIGFDVASGFNRTFKLIDLSTVPGRGFGILCVLKLAGISAMPNTWAPLPILGFCHLPEDAAGVRLILGNNTMARRMNTGASELSDNANAIANLCAMLSLKNTRTAEREPPAKVNKKRLAKGTTELYSYKVLVVDGEHWDSPGMSTTGAGGVRSHLRRGHIRTIAEGRHVWVRATYVHGSVPGFVDKDYSLTNGAKPPPKAKAP